MPELRSYPLPQEVTLTSLRARIINWCWPVSQPGYLSWLLRQYCLLSSGLHWCKKQNSYYLQDCVVWTSLWPSDDAKLVHEVGDSYSKKVSPDISPTYFDLKYSPKKFHTTDLVSDMFPAKCHHLCPCLSFWCVMQSSVGLILLNGLRGFVQSLSGWKVWY